MKPYKVLIIDDEPMAVKAIAHVITRDCPAFVVSAEAADGCQGLEKIRELSPDVVLTDIEMPLMNGLQMAKQARELISDLCFVVISGYQDYEYMQQEETLRIVTSMRGDMLNGLISIESPIGKALMGKKVGDVVTVNVDTGYSYQVEIRKIIKENDESGDRIRSF